MRLNDYLEPSDTATDLTDYQLTDKMLLKVINDQGQFYYEMPVLVQSQTSSNIELG